MRARGAAGDHAVERLGPGGRLFGAGRDTAETESSIHRHPAGPRASLKIGPHGPRSSPARSCLPMMLQLGSLSLCGSLCVTGRRRAVRHPRSPGTPDVRPPLGGSDAAGRGDRLSRRRGMRQLRTCERGSANWPFIIALILLLAFVYLWKEGGFEWR